MKNMLHYADYVNRRNQPGRKLFDDIVRHSEWKKEGEKTKKKKLQIGFKFDG
jgi:hypothetical protein